MLTNFDLVFSVHVTSGGQNYSYSVTKLHNSLIFVVTSNVFVTFLIVVTHNCSETVTFKIQ